MGQRRLSRTILLASVREPRAASLKPCGKECLRLRLGISDVSRSLSTGVNAGAHLALDQHATHRRTDTQELLRRYAAGERAFPGAALGSRTRVWTADLDKADLEEVNLAGADLGGARPTCAMKRAYRRF